MATRHYILIKRTDNDEVVEMMGPYDDRRRAEVGCNRIATALKGSYYAEVDTP